LQKQTNIYLLLKIEPQHYQCGPTLAGIWNFNAGLFLEGELMKRK
jgi:hypothetical protein